MSRTFRKRGFIPRWVHKEQSFEKINDHYIKTSRELEGPELEKVLAKFHSDAGVGDNWINEAPRWWRNLFEKMDRCATRIQLQAFKKDPEVEVIIRRKPRMDYFH